MIFQHAWQSWVTLRLRPIDNPFKGISISAAATVLNAAMGLVLIRAGARVRQRCSPMGAICSLMWSRPVLLRSVSSHVEPEAKAKQHGVLVL